MAAPSIGPIGVSSASSSSSVSSASQSLSFNPVITLASPEASIRNQPSTDQINRAEGSATSEAKAETRIPSTTGDVENGLTGFLPSLGLGGGSRVAGGSPATLAGDFIPRGGQASMFSGSNGLLLLGALAVAAFIVARKLL